jgi:hypothetical protein
MPGWLLGTGANALPGAVVLWVNKFIALFKGASHIALRDWRPDADNTAAGFGTALVIVLAATMPLVSRAWRSGFAIGSLALSGIALWRCYANFNYLDMVRVSDFEARQIQASWEYWYIVMLCSFVAAITCGLSIIRANSAPPTGGTGNDAEHHIGAAQ